MYFQQILLDLFSKMKGERSQMAPYYILRGKKSGQTLQDIHYYRVTDYFGVSPDLTKEVYHQEIEQLYATQLIVDQDSPQLTPKGYKNLETFSRPRFSYLTNTVLETLEKRLMLLIQVASNRLADQSNYYPVVMDEEVQRHIKLLIQKMGGIDATATALKEMLWRFLEASDQSDEGKQVFVHRFSGYDSAGLTWEQLAEQLGVRRLDAFFIYRSVLSELAIHVSQTSSPFSELVPKSEVLTETAKKTYQWYCKGHSFQEIARIRRLKESTIEDHFVEIASVRPDFSFEEIITQQQINEILHVQQQLKTHKLKSLRERLPQYSYFQLRLALAKGGVIT